MAISTSSIDALPDYTDAQLLKLYRWALTNNAAGQSRSIDGAMIQFPPLADMLKVIEYLTDAINADSDSDSGGDTALIVYGDPV